MRKFLLILFIFFCQVIFCQTDGEKILHGKIIVESGNGEGVTIINLVNEKSTASDSNGDFYILAKADDLLVFSSVNLEYFRKLIEENDLKLDILIIKMTSKTTELKEVIVNKHPEINAVSLGISPKDVKHYTPEERKLYTANSTPIDAVLNLISGRTAMLKKEIQVERKELFLKQLNNMFDENYFSTKLKIPLEYVKGFEYYIVDKEMFTDILKSKNKIKIEFLMGEMAIKYNEIIACENE